MFHNLCDYIKNELAEFDRKAGTNSGLTMQELEYVDLLGHIKKSLLAVDAMENPEDYGYYGNDYARGDYSKSGRGRYARRDSQGRYSSARMYRDGDMREEIYEFMDKAPNEKVRRKLEELMNEMDK